MFIESTSNVGTEKHLDIVLPRRVVRRLRGGDEPCIMPLPTDAVPGSPEKIAVLRTRVEAGLTLHHPHDLRVAVECPPRVVRPFRIRCRI